MVKLVRYSAAHDTLVLHLDNGSSVEIPRLAISELDELSIAQLRALKADNAGMTLSQRDLDIDIWVPGLLSELFSLRPGALLGKKGGIASTEAKRRSARANGKRGGRPKKL
jgi:hypothetical protein